MEKIYLITGAAGHLGNTLIRKLNEKNEKTRALVLPGEAHIPNGNAEIYYGDVRDKNSLAAFFEHTDEQELVLVHAAGIVSIASKYSQLLYDTNVGGTRNIVELCGQYGVSKLVYVSSVHAIPEKPIGEIICETDVFHPQDVVGYYAKAKSEATGIVLDAVKNGLNACIVHPTGICGPYDYGRSHLTALVVDYCKRRLTSIVTGGYDFVDVRDVAGGILQCMEKGKTGECYILSNRYFSVTEIMKLLSEVTGKKEIKRVLSHRFVKMIAPVAELYYKILRQPPLFTPYSMHTLHSNAAFSHEKAAREIGYTTRDMRATLIDTVKWLTEIGKIE